MNIGDIPFADLRSKLQDSGLPLNLGPFSVLVSTSLDAVARSVHFLYADHPVARPAEFYDARVAVQPSRGVRRLAFGGINLIVDGTVWQRFPKSLAAGALEWGLNWFLYRRIQHRLVLHAATVCRDSAALLLPADSGSGKSTLAAALMHSDWCLLSDELAVIDPRDCSLQGFGRAAILKNESLPALRKFAPEAKFGPVMKAPKIYPAVAHVRPTKASVKAVRQQPQPRWIVFPRYRAGAPAELTPLSRATGMLKTAQSGFNYPMQGETGFQTLARMIDGCECFELVYSDLAQAVRILNNLVPASSPLALSV